MLQRTLNTLIVVTLVTASCSFEEDAVGEVSDPPRVPQEKRTLPGSSVNSNLQPLVNIATKDLVARLGHVDAGEIEVLRAERVTWRSAALGCPQPDQGYMMVLTPGVLIQLRTSGDTWQYHSTLRGPPFLCEPPGRIETPSPHSPELDQT